MIDDNIKETEIPGVILINRPIFSDDRGFFHEIFRKNELEKFIGRPIEIVQQNHSRSIQDTLRGIHVAPWSKLVYVTRGLVQEVVIDLKKGSPTFGKQISINLGEENKFALFVPPECGNAFLVLSEDCDYTYLVSDYWAPGKERAIIWNDPDLKIKWQTKYPILSEKDQKNSLFQDIFPYK